MSTDSSILNLEDGIQGKIIIQDRQFPGNSRENEWGTYGQNSRREFLNTRSQISPPVKDNNNSLNYCSGNLMYLQINTMKYKAKYKCIIGDENQ